MIPFVHGSLVLLRCINPGEGLESEGEDGCSQTPCNSSDEQDYKPLAFIINFPVF